MHLLALFKPVVILAVPFVHMAVRPQPADIAVTASPEPLSGTIRTRDFHLAAGTLRLAQADLTIDCMEAIQIDGTLRGGVVRDASIATTASRGTNITLRSQTAIVIRGELAAADGERGTETGIAGGDGTTLTLEAPIIILESPLHAGAGGNGGDAAAGGLGGNILIRGQVCTSKQDRVPTISGGTGGNGGRGLTATEASTRDPADRDRWMMGGRGGDGGHAKNASPSKGGAKGIAPTPVPGTAGLSGAGGAGQPTGPLGGSGGRGGSGFGTDGIAGKPGTAR